jgi:hypothetical protein
MRPRRGSRVRHAEDGRAGYISRFYEQWDAEAGRWEPVAWVAWDDGTDSPWPLRDLVLVRRGARDRKG